MQTIGTAQGSMLAADSFGGLYEPFGGVGVQKNASCLF